MHRTGFNFLLKKTKTAVRNSWKNLTIPLMMTISRTIQWSSKKTDARLNCFWILQKRCFIRWKHNILKRSILHNFFEIMWNVYKKWMKNLWNKNKSLSCRQEKCTECRKERIFFIKMIWGKTTKYEKRTKNTKLKAVHSAKWIKWLNMCGYANYIKKWDDIIGL